MLISSARTHVGRVRSQNEDAALCRSEHGLFAVIDGMGGQEAGEVAAAIAAAALAEVPNHRRLASETVLAAAFHEARSRILRQAIAEPSQRDMGAVATAIRFEDNGRSIGLAHVGDTRAWLVNARGVRQLTHDHVRLAEGGGKSAVARDLGRQEMPADWVETARFPVAKGDLLVLASDGLHDPVPGPELVDELTRMWRENIDADAISARLIAIALARGGPDNVTVVAIRVGRYTRARAGGRWAGGTWAGGWGRRRYTLAASLVLFALLLTMVGIALFPRPPAIAPSLPDRVEGPVALGLASEFAIPAPKTTTVVAAGALVLQGVGVTGSEWTIEVGEGGALTLARSVVRLDGSLTIVLERGASLVLDDARLEAGSIRVVGAEGSRMTLRHATLETLATDGPVFEGPLEREEDDVRLLAPAPPSEPPAPVAPAESPVAPR